MKKETFKAQFNMPYYDPYIFPHGHLTSHPECHALFYYYTLVSSNLKEKKDHLYYEGEPQIETTREMCENIIKSVAVAYNVKVEAMVRFWDEVDAQAKKLGLLQIPEMFKFKKGGLLILN